MLLGVPHTIKRAPVFPDGRPAGREPEYEALKTLQAVPLQERGDNAAAG